MRLTRWQKLWLLLAVALLFFPCFFVLMELPTEARILKQWSTSMLWRIQAEIPEYRELGVWYIRQPYEGLSDRELIRVLESKFSAIDYSAIRRKFSNQLENIRRNQFLVIAEAISVYLFVVALLYANFGLVVWIVRKIGSSLARQFNRART